MKFWNWLIARLAFVFASFEFGAERILFTPPRFAKKREFVDARVRLKNTKFRAKAKNINRRGVRGK